MLSCRLEFLRKSCHFSAAGVNDSEAHLAWCRKSVGDRCYRAPRVRVVLPQREFIRHPRRRIVVNVRATTRRNAMLQPGGDVIPLLLGLRFTPVVIVWEPAIQVTKGERTHASVEQRVIGVRQILL